MKLGFEASRIINKYPTGVSRYARNLISAILSEAGAPDITLYYKLSRLGKKKYWYRPDSVKTTLYLDPVVPFFNFPDVIHGLDGFVPEWKQSKKVVTIHDLLPVMIDNGLIAPREFSEKMKSDYSKAVSIADLVITDSDSTRSDLIEHLSVPESKVVTVYPGFGANQIETADEECVASEQNTGRGYLLCLGAISSRKNTERVVRAYAVSNARDDFDLLLVGPVAYRGEATLEAIGELGLEDSVHIRGYLHDDEMIAIFRNAAGLVFPTLYEGFGFPVLEAMMFGVPVLTSNIGSSVEIAGGYAQLVDPYDVESITHGIDQLVEKQDFRLEEAKKHAAGFSWNRTAKQMLEIYKKLNSGG